jgi:drug/metabolite transporter (DMT)-like permease
MPFVGGDGMSGSAPEATAWTYGELVLVALIWGTGSVAIKIAVEGFPPLTAAGLRLAIASAMYAPLLWLNRRNMRLPRAGDLPLLLWLAVAGYLVFNILYFLALRRTTAAHAVLVWGAQPIVTAVLAALLIHEHVSRQAIVGVLISMAGVGLIVASSFDAHTAYGADALGDLLLVSLMICWVLYSVASRTAMRRFSPLASTGYACLLGFALMLPVTLAAGFRPAHLADAPLRSWLAILFSGGVSVVVSYILWNRALVRLGATRTAVFVNLSPVWGLLMSHLLAGETLGWVHLAGAALIIGGVLAANVRGSRRSAVGSRVQGAARGTQ